MDDHITLTKEEAQEIRHAIAYHRELLRKIEMIRKTPSISEREKLFLIRGLLDQDHSEYIKRLMKMVEGLEKKIYGTT